MKSMQPPLAAIFFMTYFTGRGGMVPSTLLDPLLVTDKTLCITLTYLLLAVIDAF